VLLLLAYSSFLALQVLDIDCYDLIMSQVYALAQYLQDNKINPADLQKSNKQFNRNQLFLVAYAYYLLGLTNENTRKHYKTVIDQFTRFVSNTSAINPLDAVGIDVALWREDLIRTGGIAGALPTMNLDKYYPQENSSIHNKVSILSAFFKFLQKPGLDGTPPLIAYNPVEALRQRFKVEKYSSSKKISIQTLQKIIDQIDRKTIKGARNYALIYGYFMTGRRNNEWLTLKWGQINFNTDPITYNFIRKGQKETTDELPESVLEALVEYLIIRYGEDFQDQVYSDTYLFTAMDGKGGIRQIVDPNHPLTEHSMLRILKNLAIKAGIDPNSLTVHSLRHLHAESYLDAGASVEEVRARLCHQSLATTQRYVSSMKNEKNRLANKLDEMLKKKKDTT
jgi:integrase/recombinase XerD